MRSLFVRLMLSFAAVALVGVGVAALLASQATNAEFQSYVEYGGRMYAERAAQSLADYYRDQSDWREAPVLLAALRRSAEDRLVLADARGVVVADTQGVADGRPVRELGLRVGTPIVVEGVAVGTLYVPSFAAGRGPIWARRPAAGNSTGALSSLPARGAPVASAEGEFLRRTNWSLFTGATVAGVVALALGLLLTRQIVGPVRALTLGARRLAAGDLAQRVPVARGDEIGELATAFNQMAASLARQEEVRRHLLADVAHELNTPLTVIQGTADGILDGVLESGPEQARIIKEEAVLLARLVEDLRDLSLAEAGQLRLDRTEVDVAALAQEALNRVAAPAAEKGVELALDAAPDLPPISVDPARLLQILGNLLANALRHTRPGGQVAIHLQTDQDEHTPALHLAVTDTGEGIPAEVLPYVFDRFYRADQSRSRRTGGTGLGLAIVRQLVEMHGGRVWAESLVGRGSTFHVRLPIGS